MQTPYGASPVPGQSGPVPAPKHARMVPSWPAWKAGVVRAEGIEPTRPCGRRIFIPLRLSPPRKCGFVVWTIPSPFPIRGLGAARLVSTPSRNCFRAWLGIAISGFPDFEQFYSAGFPMGTQVLKSAASAISPRPREIGHSPIIKQVAMIYASSAKRMASTRPRLLLKMEGAFKSAAPD